MSARAPQAIYELWSAIKAAVPEAQLGGIVGDVNHPFGYHLARRDLPAGDYSVQLPKDKLGKADCASALDVTLPPELMIACTRRLRDAAVAGDSRLAALREFCGTVDGKQTFPWDLSTNRSEGIGSWDSSHLWHIHLSFYREFADDASALAPIAEVFTGQEADVALSDADVQKIKQAVIDKGGETVAGALRRVDDIQDAVAALAADVQALTETVSRIKAAGPIDPAVLAKQFVEHLIISSK